MQIAKVQLNGRDVQPEKMERRDFDVSGSPSAGFVRRDTKDRSRFAYDNGNSYYPLGQSVAFLKDRLCPARPPDEKRLARLIADLDAGSLQKRDAASRELSGIGG